MVKSEPPTNVLEKDIGAESGTMSGGIAPDSAEPVSVAHALAEALKREGQNLFRTKRLIQKTSVTALQLHRPYQSVDPVLVSPNSRVAVLTDPYGQAALSYAALRPHWQVTGWVADTKTFMGLQNLATPQNLEFDKKPKAGVTNAADAILAVSWAHQLFSEKQYHVSELVKGVKELLGMLPDHGQLLIQDFALPEQHDSFVILELGNQEAIDALQEFSQTARPHAPKALQGFFIEVMTTERAGVQRFRLPLKWAVEFYHRWRHGIAMNVPFELTTLSLPQWTSLVEQCGARVTYQAPHFLSRKEAKELVRDVRFFDEQGKDFAFPATSFTLVIEKIPSTATLQLYERRISSEQAKDIRVSGLKNANDNTKIDVVEIRHHQDDVLPWYRDVEGHLHVLVRTNVARPIINSVPRGTPNLDGRHWAGYLIEPLGIQHLDGILNPAAVIEEIQHMLPLSSDVFGTALLGVEYYPAPEFLVQRVRGILLPLNRNAFEGLLSFESDAERVIDVRADDVLRAISAGLIPDGKLEILIGALMGELGINPADYIATPEHVDAMRATKFIKDRREAKQPRQARSGEHMMEYLADAPSDNLRAVRSVFVEDQISEYGRHIANTTEQDFLVTNNLSANTAVCIPLIRDPIKGVMMSAEPRRLPIPQRMGATDPVMQLPSFSLPSTIKTIDEARAFLAKQIGCAMDDLHVMGPSFFVQPNLSAERVYPFLLTAPDSAMLFMRWFKPRNVGLQRGIDRHIDKTCAFVEYKFGRDVGEWFMGFDHEITNHLKTISVNGPAESALSARILNQHPAAKPKL
jgi:hypothetical protein